MQEIELESGNKPQPFWTQFNGQQELTRSKHRKARVKRKKCRSRK